MYKMLVPMFCLALLLGCTPAEETDAPPTVAGRGLVLEPENLPLVEPETEDIKDIGDAEQEIRIAATVAEQSKTPLLEENVMQSARDEIMMSTVNVTPPPPQELWIHFHVSATAPFKVQPVVVRGRVMRDDEEIGTFSTYVGQYGGYVAPEGVTLPQSEFTFNVLQGLPQIPDTMLVHAEVDLSLMPVGTDEATLDPATAQTTPEFTVPKRSNPVRINFTPAAQ